MKEFLDLFWTFIKIGAVTFGGGYAMVPVLERELIRGKGWITMDEVMDYYTIAQITPGLIAINVSTFVGYKRKGIPGGIIATIGFIIPGITLMTIISVFISRFTEYEIIQHVFAGIRVAVGALVLNTVLKMVKGIIKEPISATFFIAAFVLSVLLKQSPIYVILAAGFLGWLVYRLKLLYRQKEQNKKSGGAE